MRLVPPVPHAPRHRRPARPLASLGPALLLLLTLQPAGVALGQTGGFEGPQESGSEDGRRSGLLDGRDLGRAQSLYAAFRRGFAQGLQEARSPGLLQRVTEEAERAGREAGRLAGEEAAAGAVRDALRRSPSARAEPEVPEPPAVQGACPPARPLRVHLTRTRTVEMDPDGLESRPSPLQRDAFRVPFRSTDELRQRARDAGATGQAVGEWVRDYEFYFQSAYQEAFEDEREGTPVPDQRELEAVGRQWGREEGDRRVRCTDGAAAFRLGHAEAFRGTYAEAYGREWEEARSRRASRAIVAVPRATLLDASGDGLLEPGEHARLEVELVNVGAVAARRSAGSWEGLRGLSGKGYFEAALEPGERRELGIDLGPTDERAPPGTSVVVRVRGLGGDEIVASQRLQRPVGVEDVASRLDVRDGNLRVVTTATLQSSRAGAAGRPLVLAMEGAAESVEPPGPGGTSRVELVGPAALAALGGSAQGRLVLGEADGIVWQATSWSVEVPVPTAVSLAARLQDPEAGARALAARMLALWERAVEEGGSADLSEIQAFGEALERVDGPARDVLERVVRGPLLERAAGQDVPRPLRKAMRQALRG